MKKSEMEDVYRLAKENNLLDGEYKFNMKYSLAEYFMDRAKKEGVEYHIFLNLYAYDCQFPIKPESEVDGQIHRCQSGDIKELVDMMDMFHSETGVDQKDREGYLADARNRSTSSPVASEIYFAVIPVAQR